MNEGCCMPVAVFNPWTGKQRFVFVHDAAEAACIVANGWEILRGVVMTIDESGVVQVES